MPDFDAGLPTLEQTLEKISSLQQSQASLDVAPSEPGEPGLYGESTETPEFVTDTAPAGAEVEAGPAETAPAPAEVGPQSAHIRKLMESEQRRIELEQQLAEARRAPQAESPPKEMTLRELQSLYKYDKRAALKALDSQFDPGSTARELWYYQLGDKAPVEARAEMDANRALSTAEQLRAEMLERDQRVTNMIQQHKDEIAYQHYVGAMEAYTANIPDEQPLVKQYIAKKPDKVVQALIAVAQKHLNDTGGREVLTPAQAVARLEEGLKELQFGVPTPAAPTKAPAEVDTPHTLRNKHTSVQASRGDTSLDDDTLMKQAMAEIERAKRQASQG